MTFDFKKVFIVTAPSGAGKTTLNRKLLQEPASMVRIATSYTTRSSRKNEKHGDHYWFVSKEMFQEKIQHGEMLEWAEVYGNYYGTSKQELERLLQQNHKVILEIDSQGRQQVVSRIPQVQSIFILPPSLRVLWSRLDQRNTDTSEKKNERFEACKTELRMGKTYENFIINDHLETAYQELKAFILYNQPLSVQKEEGFKYIDQLLTQDPKSG